MEKIDIKTLVEQVQKNDNKEEALTSIMNTFGNYILSKSIIDGNIDDDCIQELNIKLVDCIKKFQV